MSAVGFEGSFLGANDKISDQAIMECKICWTPYDPLEGDDTRSILPGTPFLALPEDWKCPNCDAPKELFLVSEDPGSDAMQAAARLARKTEALVSDFTEVWHAKMRDVPIVNKLLHVQAVGFMEYEGRPLGVLISPWFMNLLQLPAEGEDWSGLIAGEKEIISFPSGDYEFIHNTREQTGGYKACSLFSPMGEFKTQAQAVDVAKAVMVALFQEEHRAETDRSADIRAAREQEVAEQAEREAEEQEVGGEELTASPTRRQVLTAGMSEAPKNESEIEEGA
ncbi:[NiFe]-hydrogenase assembly chaperone HybE [Celeribacter halophilus]|uniref:[NiFe] hydrogenase assembly chaperone, HybE family n=1 Tax=Celeribacter halophilus TaxID=576117 RepID=A0A1I3QP78_9RHOB|nr:[NiFe]-hydrogenase assembly chaperone HybE [Celeribacter halophilus]PZX13362.1 [NiFe] hydrogenase assembly HybE family chaperone [Celeribacter halophilus]SFJ35665.1 [NiFe] hydrogenase assembly chaperone, HybE family [Celeribacter halophilus]